METTTQSEYRRRRMALYDDCQTWTTWAWGDMYQLIEAMDDLIRRDALPTVEEVEAWLEENKYEWLRNAEEASPRPLAERIVETLNQPAKPALRPG